MQAQRENARTSVNAKERSIVFSKSALSRRSVEGHAVAHDRGRAENLLRTAGIKPSRLPNADLVSRNEAAKRRQVATSGCVAKSQIAR